MSLHLAAAVGSEGLRAPPIKAVGMPQRLQRTRRRNAFTPPDAIYVGRPTLWGNPFSERYRIGHARSVILYGNWIEGKLSPHVLRCARFSETEIEALGRWRSKLIAKLDRLRGRDLQCWCPLTSAWCHAETLLRIANGPREAWPA